MRLKDGLVSKKHLEERQEGRRRVWPSPESSLWSRGAGDRPSQDQSGGVHFWGTDLWRKFGGKHCSRTARTAPEGAIPAPPVRQPASTSLQSSRLGEPSFSAPPTAPVSRPFKVPPMHTPLDMLKPPLPISFYPGHLETTPMSKYPPLPDVDLFPESPKINEASMKSSPGATTASRADKPHMDVQQRAEAAAARARARIAEEEKMVLEQGSLADNSLFADPLQHQRAGAPAGPTALGGQDGLGYDPAALELRNPSHLEAAINPKPRRRALWQRRMVIRNVRQRGRLTKTIKIARSERSCLSRSLIEIDAYSYAEIHPPDALLQEESRPRSARAPPRSQTRSHRHPRHGTRPPRTRNLWSPAPQPSPAPTTTTLPPSVSPTTTSTTIIQTHTPPTPSKPATLPGTSIPSNPAHRSPTDIYISQAWINRGPYRQKPDYRAFGRVFIMRPPHTGLSVLLKEEKTRAREKADREIKRIRQRMGRSMWTQLPDRKISRQGQYLLW
ncbi:hypothetical protein EPUS_03106 [Endocarpon pusillum Z07020]|uniref:Uncharacterized protein n=1 Tax=Endocarpon pusillum (strain Z07020 / HMAS-L-300199) TaxID=1263415 RepID=U1HVA0_ENDPU|nr:uncharacterized protein EPUS_03106 [Endocarpon pusillum Z07020]ERF73274.1 hypothetical protein EPUS_03106 [Endocarpon pusillum Z07020]